MINLREKEENLLKEVIDVLNDPSETVFGYFKVELENSSDNYLLLRSLETNGLIKIDWIDEYPINIELSKIGKNYFKDKETDMQRKQIIERKIKKNNIYLCFVSLIFGIIIGLLLYHFFLI